MIIRQLEEKARALGYRLHRGEGDARATDEEWAEALEDALFESFYGAYVQTLLWTAGDAGGELTASEAEQCREDCFVFWTANRADLVADPCLGGHDFALTRNYDGTGFWDGGWADGAGRRLTMCAHEMGEWALERGE